VATTLLLIRHAAHDLLGRTLCGRMAGVELNERGHRQAALLAERLGRAPAALYSSPMPRALQTAAPLAARFGLEIRPSEALLEIDFGAWAGRDFASLEGDPLWQRWNAERASARTPEGETMAEVQQRALAGLGDMAARHPEAVVAAVSHGDVIKAVIAAVLGLSLDAHARFEIGPAGLSRIEFWPGGAKLLSMNEDVAA
jgi:probable phosphoglycerate mutase